jgi:ABC-type transporter Mla MlaB component
VDFGCEVLDLSRLSFIDSSGLHITIELHKHSTRQNIRLVIIPDPARCNACLRSAD